MMTSLEWKKFYAKERDALLGPTLNWWLELDAAPLPENGFLLFPHTRLLRSVEQIVPVALALLQSQAKEVLAIGPLHGGRAKDLDLVMRARAGEEPAVREVRGIHTGDSDLAAEEFCLDTFDWLLGQLAGRMDVKAPQVHRRHPFLTGDDASTLPGFRRVKELVESGVPVVATGDLIHHGAGYSTPPAEQKSRNAPESTAWAKAEIERSLQLLASNNLVGFREHAGRIKSDLRDVGPLLRTLFPGTWAVTVEPVALIGYEDVLKTPPPTWVSSALVRVTAAKH